MLVCETLTYTHTARARACNAANRPLIAAGAIDLHLSVNSVVDMASNSVADTTIDLSLVADTTKPSVTAVELDLQTLVLKLTLNEPVKINTDSSFVKSRIHLNKISTVDDSGLDMTHAASVSNTETSNIVTFSLTPTKLLTFFPDGVYSASTALYLDLDAAAFADLAGLTNDLQVWGSHLVVFVLYMGEKCWWSVVRTLPLAGGNTYDADLLRLHKLTHSHTHTPFLYCRTVSR